MFRTAIAIVGSTPAVVHDPEVQSPADTDSLGHQNDEAHEHDPLFSN